MIRLKTKDSKLQIGSCSLLIFSGYKIMCEKFHLKTADSVRKT